MTALQRILAIRKLKRLGALFQGRAEWSIDYEMCKTCAREDCYRVGIIFDNKGPTCSHIEYFRFPPTR